jgi:glycosyltransferase involved in cell wall biosynthesis
MTTTTNKTKKRKPVVLCVGADLTSNGGIANVIKCYHHEWSARPSGFDYRFIKTSYYQDKPAYCEPFAFLSALIQLLLCLMFKDVALVHVHTSFGWSLLRKSIVVFISSLFRRRIILHIHTGRIYRWFLPRSRLLGMFVSMLLRRCDVILVLCQDWEEKLHQRYPFAKIVVLENPFNRDETVIRAEDPHRDFVVFFVGFLFIAKGIKDILEIAKMAAADELSDMRFVIAGKGNLEELVLDSIARDGPEANVECVGWIAGDRKKELLSSASLFFLPSYIEGMPMSILEAMNYGLPILSTRISGIPDLVEDGENGYLLEPGDVKGFYAVIKKLYYDRPLLQRLGRNSKERSKRFTSDVIYGRLLEVYSQVTDGKIGPSSTEV